MAKTLGPRAETVALTSVPGTERSCPLPRLIDAFKTNTRSVFALEDPCQALDSVKAGLGADDVLVICGSLYLVGWARNLVLGASLSI
ncbi:MAG: hypothetical protein NVSMB52_00770 [Chloroflexota bacterium]